MKTDVIKVVIITGDKAFRQMLVQSFREAYEKNFPDIEILLSSFEDTNYCVEKIEGKTDILVLHLSLKKEEPRGHISGFQALKRFKSNNPNCIVLESEAMPNPESASRVITQVIDLHLRRMRSLGLRRFFRNGIDRHGRGFSSN